MSQRRAKKSRRKRGKKSEVSRGTPDGRRSTEPSFEIEQLEQRILLSATWTGTAGDDVFAGTTGADEAYGLEGNDDLHGDAKNDLLCGGAGNDQLFGDDGHDTLDGGAGTDQLFGGQGNDDLISGGGSDVMDGGIGNDTFRFTGAQNGDAITVVGDAGGQDTIDLAGYSNNQITDDGSTITVDMGGGQSFTINYTEVNKIVTSEGNYLPGELGGGNEVPDAVDDSVLTDEDTPVTTDNVLANDGDPDGDPLSITDFTQGANGTVVNNGDGTFTYTPNANFSGSDSFTYTVDDGSGGTDTATVDVTVEAVNDAPMAAAGEDQVVDEGAGVTLDASGSSDLEGDTLSYTWTQTDGPAVVLSDTGAAQPTFTAPGVSEATTLTFQVEVSDGNAAATETVKVIVNPIAEAPPPPPPPDPPLHEPPPPTGEVDDPAPEPSNEPVADEPEVVDEPVVPDDTEVLDELNTGPESPVDSTVQPPVSRVPDGVASDPVGGTDSTPAAPSVATEGGSQDVIDATSEPPSATPGDGPSGFEGVQWDGDEDLEVVDPLAGTFGSVELDEEPPPILNPSDHGPAEPNIGADLAARFDMADAVMPPSFEDAPAQPVVVDLPGGATAHEVFEEVGAGAQGLPPEAAAAAEGPRQVHQAQAHVRAPAPPGVVDEFELEARRGARSVDDAMSELPPHGGEGSDQDAVGGDDSGVTAASSDQTGFLARLWGAVRGLTGTSRRIEDRESLGRSNRR